MRAMVADMAVRFGLNPLETKRFIKFAVVGSIGFIVDFGIFNILLGPLNLLFAEGSAAFLYLLEYGLPLNSVRSLATTSAGAISFVAAIMSNFIWNRYWTYPDSRGKSVRRQFAMFTVVSVAGFLIRIAIIFYTHYPFTDLVAPLPLLAPYAERIGDNLALILSVLVVMFWNFFVNRYWTYNDVDNGNHST
ncbi:MAG: GtrA family protein [Chloroflexota bacterium]|jgi:putative flippase GtrA